MSDRVVSVKDEEEGTVVRCIIKHRDAGRWGIFRQFGRRSADTNDIDWEDIQMQASYERSTFGDALAKSHEVLDFHESQHGDYVVQERNPKSMADNLQALRGG